MFVRSFASFLVEATGNKDSVVHERTRTMADDAIAAAARSSFGRRRKATLTDDGDGSSDDSTFEDDGWSPSEDAALRKCVEQHGRNFKKIIKEMGTTRTEAQLEARIAKVRSKVVLFTEFERVYL